MSVAADLVSRRTFLAGSLSALLLAGLTACSSGKPEPGESPKPSPTPSFPAKVSHKYGTTTVKAQPQRVVVIGNTDQDALLAFGVVPIATTQWLGDDVPYAIYPWAQDKLGDAKPTLLDLTDGLPLDQIRKLKPDLIVGTNAGLSQTGYETLSKIAPTIPNSGTSGNDFDEPWPSQTLLIGQAVGQADQAQQLVTALTQRYADLAAAHPQWAGVKAAFVNAPYDDGTVIAWPAGSSSSFLTDLGFKIPAGIDKFVGKDVVQASIPASATPLLNEAKMLVWGTDDPADGADIRNDKVLGKITAVRDDKSVYTDATLAAAIYFSTVLSLPYVIDHLTPELERVLPA